MEISNLSGICTVCHRKEFSAQFIQVGNSEGYKIKTVIWEKSCLCQPKKKRFWETITNIKEFLTK